MFSRSFLIDQNFDYKSLIRYVDDRPGHDFDMQWIQEKLIIQLDG